MKKLSKTQLVAEALTLYETLRQKNKQVYILRTKDVATKGRLRKNERDRTLSAE